MQPSLATRRLKYRCVEVTAACDSRTLELLCVGADLFNRQNKDILEQLSSSLLSNAADRKALQEELRQQFVLSASCHAETAVLVRIRLLFPNSLGKMRGITDLC